MQRGSICVAFTGEYFYYPRKQWDHEKQGRLRRGPTSGTNQWDHEKLANFFLDLVPQTGEYCVNDLYLKSVVGVGSIPVVCTIYSNTHSTSR